MINRNRTSTPDFGSSDDQAAPTEPEIGALDLTTHDVAGMLNSSPTVVRDMARLKRLPAAKVGGQWRFSRTLIVQFISKALEG